MVVTPSPADKPDRFQFTEGDNCRLHYLASRGEVRGITNFFQELAQYRQDGLSPYFMALEDNWRSSTSKPLPEPYLGLLNWRGLGANTPLHWAVHAHSWPMVNFLVACGADLEAPNANGVVPFEEIWLKEPSLIQASFLNRTKPPFPHSSHDWIFALLHKPPYSFPETERLLRLFISRGCQPNLSCLIRKGKPQVAHAFSTDEGQSLLAICRKHHLAQQLPLASPSLALKIHL